MKNSSTLFARANAALSLVLVLLALWLLLVCPGEARESAGRGLSVCAGLIIPSLLPFFVLSGLVSALGIPELLAFAAGRPLGRLLGNPLACAPLLLGLLGGYPTGAAALAELVKAGKITPHQGERLLPAVNNTGPAFIIGAAGAGVFGSAKLGAALYLSHILASLALAAIFVCRRGMAQPPQRSTLSCRSLAEAVPAVMKSAVSSTLNICGYVVFFSVITGLLDAAGVFSRLAGELSLLTGAGLHFCRSLLAGLMELGSGIGSMAGLAPTAENLALASFILGFGSLSVHCQTLAVIADTEMRCVRHFAGRIMHGAFSAIFTFLLFKLLQS